MRTDLSVDCNAPERARWLGYAGVMIIIYPVGGSEPGLEPIHCVSMQAAPERHQSAPRV